MSQQIEDIKERLAKFPPAHTIYTEMQTPNEEFMIYEGDFSLKEGKNIYKVTGNIIFKWLPALGIKVNGRFIDSSPGIDEYYFDVILDGIVLCGIILENFSIGKEVSFVGSPTTDPIVGDKTISVQNINFILPNMRKYIGNIIKSETENLSWVGRLLLEDEKYKIEIDMLPDYNNKFDMLKNEGGYISLHNGHMFCKKGAISSDESDDIFMCLSKFLSFVNGRRVSPLHRKGLHEGEIIWTNYSNYLNDIYKNVVSWIPESKIELNSAWNNFTKLWTDKDNKDFLISVIHWYVEANSNSGFLEGSIILIQIALELIYNWYVVEQNKLIVGKDSEDICAANKIRLLMSQVGIKKDISIMLPLLKNKLLGTNQSFNDEIDVFVQIRNAIVHSQKDKRAKLNGFTTDEKYEAKKFGLWLIELSILKIVGYKGKYYNRCNDLDENVPYII